MKHKRGREDHPIKVISDPKKLAWLRAEIQKRKARAVQKGVSKAVNRMASEP